MNKPSARAILLTVAIGVFVAADDLTVVTTMLRPILADLSVALPDELDLAAWIVNAYLIAYVGIMPFIGRVSDIVGRRAVYVGSMTLFLIGSIWIPLSLEMGQSLSAALPPGFELFGQPVSQKKLTYAIFLVGRVMTALGGGAMVPVSMAVIADVYPPGRRASALGVLGAVETSGWVWGPLYGALLVRFLNWEWQFYLNIPLAIIGIATAWWALQDLPRPEKPPRLDWAGAVTLTLALLFLNIGLSNSGSAQFVENLSDIERTSAARTVPYFIAFAIMLAIFVFVERHLVRNSLRQPMLDLTLFLRHNFTPAVLVNFFVGLMLIIGMVSVPLIVNVLEIETQRAAVMSGWLLSAMTGAMTVLTVVGGRWTERRGDYRLVTLVGLAFCFVGLMLVGWSWEPATTRGTMAWQLATLGVGFGLVTAPVGAAIINAAPESERGIASSLVIVFRLLGMSVGLSVLTAWGQYRFNLLRTGLELPSITDANFAEALETALQGLTVQVLAETFLLAGIVAIISLVVATRLRPDAD